MFLLSRSKWILFTITATTSCLPHLVYCDEKKTIFISYRDNSDREFAKKVAQDLRNKHFKVFCTAIDPPDPCNPIDQRILTALGDTVLFVPVLSRKGTTEPFKNLKVNSEIDWVFLEQAVARQLHLSGKLPGIAPLYVGENVGGKREHFFKDKCCPDVKTNPEQYRFSVRRIEAKEKEFLKILDPNQQPLHKASTVLDCMEFYTSANIIGTVIDGEKDVRDAIIAVQHAYLGAVATAGVEKYFQKKPTLIDSEIFEASSDEYKAVLTDRLHESVRAMLSDQSNKKFPVIERTLDYSVDQTVEIDYGSVGEAVAKMTHFLIPHLSDGHINPTISNGIHQRFMRSITEGSGGGILDLGYLRFRVHGFTDKMTDCSVLESDKKEITVTYIHFSTEFIRQEAWFDMNVRGKSKIRLIVRKKKFANKKSMMNWHYLNREE